jgi:hypothetical protein
MDNSGVFKPIQRNYAIIASARGFAFHRAQHDSPHLCGNLAVPFSIRLSRCTGCLRHFVIPFLAMTESLFVIANSFTVKQSRFSLPSLPVTNPQNKSAGNYSRHLITVCSSFRVIYLINNFPASL